MEAVFWHATNQLWHPTVKTASSRIHHFASNETRGKVAESCQEGQLWTLLRKHRSQQGNTMNNESSLCFPSTILYFSEADCKPWISVRSEQVVASTDVMKYLCHKCFITTHEGSLQTNKKNACLCIYSVYYKRILVALSIRAQNWYLHPPQKPSKGRAVVKKCLVKLYFLWKFDSEWHFTRCIFDLSRWKRHVNAVFCYQHSSTLQNKSIHDLIFGVNDRELRIVTLYSNVWPIKSVKIR